MQQTNCLSRRSHDLYWYTQAPGSCKKNIFYLLCFTQAVKNSFFTGSGWSKDFDFKKKLSKIIIIVIFITNLNIVIFVIDNFEVIKCWKAPLESVNEICIVIILINKLIKCPILSFSCKSAQYDVYNCYQFRISTILAIQDVTYLFCKTLLSTDDCQITSDPLPILFPHSHSEIDDCKLPFILVWSMLSHMLCTDFVKILLSNITNLCLTRE